VLDSTSGSRLGRIGLWAATHQWDPVRVHLIKAFEPVICIHILSLLFFYISDIVHRGRCMVQLGEIGTLLSYSILWFMHRYILSG
jgi:hypothetical protein